MLNLKTPRQITLIVNNVVRACSDIEKLNKTGYNYINLCSSFIAHYNLYGFKDHYRTGLRLQQDILVCQKQNQWHNFRQGDEYYEYYNQKAKIYNLICDRLSL